MTKDNMKPLKYVTTYKIPRQDIPFLHGILQLHDTDKTALLVKGIPPLDLVQFF